MASQDPDSGDYFCGKHAEHGSLPVTLAQIVAANDRLVAVFGAGAQARCDWCGDQLAPVTRP